MLRTLNLKPTNSIRKTNNSEYSRIISAAVINERFRLSLLHSPSQAIDCGYYGEFFNVNAQEKAKIEAIRASNLVEFATGITQI